MTPKHTFRAIPSNRKHLSFKIVTSEPTIYDMLFPIWNNWIHRKIYTRNEMLLAVEIGYECIESITFQSKWKTHWSQISICFHLWAKRMESNASRARVCLCQCHLQMGKTNVPATTHFAKRWRNTYCECIWNEYWIPNKFQCKQRLKCLTDWFLIFLFCLLALFYYICDDLYVILTSVSNCGSFFFFFRIVTWEKYCLFCFVYF